VPTEGVLVGYPLRETLAGSGGVARAVCHVGREGLLEHVIEVRDIRKKDAWIVGVEGEGAQVELTGDELASMNLWGLTPGIVEGMRRRFVDFLRVWGASATQEFFLSSAINAQIDMGSARVRALPHSRSLVRPHARGRPGMDARHAPRAHRGGRLSAGPRARSPRLTGADAMLPDHARLDRHRRLRVGRRRRGLYFARRAGRETSEFFLGGRSMPWWLLGTSMVATTFSTDTPNLVTDLVRTGGVSQNWLWWAFLITGMCTVFFYAKLWRRSGC
jgi:hypothetical protein